MKNDKLLLLLVLFGLVVGGTMLAYSGEPLVYPPNITIIFPVNNTVYSSTSLDLNSSSNESLVNVFYDLDGNGNVSLMVGICYQESANVSTACGGVNTGKYSTDKPSTWEFSNSGSLIYDSDYNSYDRATNPTGNIYINYTIPNGATNSAKWQVKTQYILSNYTVNISGLILSLKLESNISCGVNSGAKGYFLYNEIWKEVFSECDHPNSLNIYEEAIWWNFSSNITLTSLSEGKHNVTIYANNSLGNMGQSSYVYFTINQTPQWSNNKTNITSNTQLNDVGQFNITLTDNWNLSSATFSWNVSGWQNLSQINFTKTTTNVTLSFNYTIDQSTSKHKAWTIYFNDSIGNRNQTDIFLFNIKNQLPSVASASINNSVPIDADDLQCNNGSLSDPDSDSVSLLYNWTKNSIDQAISTKTLSNTLTTAGDNWICKITPFDAFENGTTKTSSGVSVGTGFVAPIINKTNATPLTAELLKGEWINLSVNFTDINNAPSENHTAYFCKTDSANPNGCTGTTFCRSEKNISANSYLSCRLNITNSSDFPLGATTFYTFVVDNTSLISASKSNTFTIQDITAPVILFNFSQLSITDGSLLNLSINITENISEIQTITFNLSNPNGVNLQRLNPTHFSITKNISRFNYTIFESQETSVVGTWNLTYVSVTDTQTNIVNQYPNQTFTVTTTPSGGGGNTGGGGGGITPKPIQNITIVAPERCGNFVCEECRDSNISNCIDETPLSCPQDCKLFSLDDTFCTPIFNCGNWLQSWFLNFSLFVVVAGLIITQYRADKKKKRLS